MSGTLSKTPSCPVVRMYSIRGALNWEQGEWRGTLLPLAALFDHLQRPGATSISGSRPLFHYFMLLFVSSNAFFTLFPLLPSSLPFLPLPSFFPSAWQGQLSVHEEQGCSRRHLWKRAPAANLSSSAIPGQGRLQGTWAVRRHTPEEGGGMRQEERKGNEMQWVGRRKGVGKKGKIHASLILIY